MVMNLETIAVLCGSQGLEKNEIEFPADCGVTESKYCCDAWADALECHEAIWRGRVPITSEWTAIETRTAFICT